MSYRSSRLPRDLTPNPLALAVARRRQAGAPLADLTESNPTRVGLAYPPDLLASLGDPAALAYRPEPFGLAAARTAVVADYARRGIAVDAAHVCLCASTSEAYAWLFKLCCDAGDRVLVPRPSYPLFEHLTALENVEAVPYELDRHAHWQIDAAALEARIDGRTRAILVVSPNNPTGSTIDPATLEAIAQLAHARGLAIIGDEVFADYTLDDAREPAVSVVQQSQAMAFSLGGLSKSVGLPQVKVGWIVAAGPADRVAEALAGLEIIADTFLSVSTPAQVALPRLLTAGAVVRDSIRERLARNLNALRHAVAAVPSVTLLPVSGGWSAVLQVPALRSEEALVLTLLEEDGVLVHPGYFFDFADEAYLVVSLLVAPDVFDAAIGRLLARVRAA